jgi:hypothetical protein
MNKTVKNFPSRVLTEAEKIQNIIEEWESSISTSLTLAEYLVSKGVEVVK